MSRFGGHETFTVREGWFTKALGKIVEKGDLFKDPLACDELGVGRNMAKSIHHWVRVAGLVEQEARGEPLELSELGELIMRKDPYFLREGTWWALHTNIVTQRKDAVAWGWFFNRSYPDRFDRLRVSSEMLRELGKGGHRVPKPATLAKDVVCLLSSYSASVPPEVLDPEEGMDCPFQSLSLITHLRETDTYQVNRNRKGLPAAIVGYAFAASNTDADAGKHVTRQLAQAHAEAYGPGKALALDLDAFADALRDAQDELGPDLVSVEMAGGSLSVRVRSQDPVWWLKKYYGSGQ